MLIAIIALVVLACVFSPYGALRYRTNVEQWTTRERSHGWPYYAVEANRDTSKIDRSTAQIHGTVTTIGNVILLQ